MVYIDFSQDTNRMLYWAGRIGVEFPLDPYTIAQQSLRDMAVQLVQFQAFHDKQPSDSRMLFTVSRNDPAVGSAMLMEPNQFIELPVHASHFFDPDLREHWESVFHSKIWFDSGSTVPGTNTAMDLLNLLQCLLPGMLLIMDNQNGRCTARGIPSLTWIRENNGILKTSIGRRCYDALAVAAANVEKAVIDSRDIVPSCYNR